MDMPKSRVYQNTGRDANKTRRDVPCRGRTVSGDLLIGGRSLVGGRRIGLDCTYNHLVWDLSGKLGLSRSKINHGHVF